MISRTHFLPYNHVQKANRKQWRGPNNSIVIYSQLQQQIQHFTVKSQANYWHTGISNNLTSWALLTSCNNLANLVTFNKIVAYVWNSSRLIWNAAPHLATILTKKPFSLVNTLKRRSDNILIFALSVLRQLHKLQLHERMRNRESSRSCWNHSVILLARNNNENGCYTVRYKYLVTTKVVLLFSTCPLPLF